MKARFTGGVGKGFNSSVIQVATSIEDYLLNTLGESTLSYKLSNNNRGITATTISLKGCAEIFIKS